MRSYLDHYGEGEDRRNRIIIRAITVTVTVAVLGSLSWYVLKNHHQEGVVKAFVSAVRKGDLPTAYKAWGCNSPAACSGYSFDSFAADWGPNAKSGTVPSADFRPDAGVLGITDSESCNSGVLLTVAVNQTRTEKVWVDRNSDAINFAPYPVCPHKNPWAIMLHRTVGKLRKPFLK